MVFSRLTHFAEHSFVPGHPTSANARALSFLRQNRILSQAWVTTCIYPSASLQHLVALPLTVGIKAAVGQGMQAAPGDPDCSAMGSKHLRGDVPHVAHALGSASLTPTSSAHQQCTPAVHGFCLSHALPDAGCFLVHSRHLVVCVSLDTVGAVQTLLCSSAMCTF